MATYGGTSGRNPCLTRGDCIGCHAYNSGGGANEVSIGGSLVPQVWHAGTDLAAGNFKYIATDTDDAKGHNVAAIAVESTITTSPPGDEHSSGITTDLTCAGVKGCHGDRGVTDETTSVKGAHHGNVNGLINAATSTGEVADSYRFLKGVYGHENMHATYKYQNYNTQYHNEYWGNVSATEGTSATAPAGNTISGLCGECHGTFHGDADIGGDTSSPFTRHPTDVVLKGSGEYTNYTTYSVVAPVARTDITTVNTAGVNNLVAPGGNAVIMCLSCHGAHATNYYKMMRWDYKNASLLTALEGCVVCHTSKD
ncbi:MAG: hypothetical protein KKF52_05730 [Nanoarchaeota archaeon]|nr:hypothetical protein [Nanoarchaeota archaeon]